MFSRVDFSEELVRLRERERNQEELLLSEAKRILQNDLFTDSKILNHLNDYGRSFEHLDEEDVSGDCVFTEQEIKKVSIRHRLKFLPSSTYNQEIPYEV